MEWKNQAACRKMGVSLFYNKKSLSEKNIAKEICNKCNVKKECLAYALKTEKITILRSGIWGGLNPKERQKLSEEKNGISH